MSDQPVRISLDESGDDLFVDHNLSATFLPGANLKLGALRELTDELTTVPLYAAYVSRKSSEGELESYAFETLLSRLNRTYPPTILATSQELGFTARNMTPRQALEQILTLWARSSPWLTWELIPPLYLSNPGGPNPLITLQIPVLSLVQPEEGSGRRSMYSFLEEWFRIFRGYTWRINRFNKLQVTSPWWVTPSATPILTLDSLDVIDQSETIDTASIVNRATVRSKQWGFKGGEEVLPPSFFLLSGFDEGAYGFLDNLGLLPPGVGLPPPALVGDTRETLKVTPASGQILTLRLSDGGVHDVTLTANCRIELSLESLAVASAASVTVIVRQGGAGGFVPTFANVWFPDDTQPSWSVDRRNFDVVTLVKIPGKEWIGSAVTGFVDPMAFVPSGPPDNYTHYRLRILAANGLYVQVAEVEMRLVANGGNIVTGGIATGTGGVPGAAFDRSPDTAWSTTSGTPLPVTLGYIFPSVRKVIQYTVTASGIPSAAPKEWEFQASNDGVNWVNIHVVTNQTGWTAQQKRVFTPPLGT